MRRALVVAGILLMAPADGMAAGRTLGRWEVRVAPLDRPSTHVAHTLAATGPTSIAVPGSGWSCAAEPPAQHVDAGVRKERAVLSCETSGKQSAMILAECRSSADGAAQVVLDGSWVLTLACTAIAPTIL